MIKLKKEVNKSAIMRELRKKADKMYENSWEREYAIEKFMEGAESLFNLLRLPVVSNSSKTKANKKEPTTLEGNLIAHNVEFTNVYKNNKNKNHGIYSNTN